MLLTKKNLFLMISLAAFLAGVLGLFGFLIPRIVKKGKFFHIEVVEISKNYLNQPTPEKIARDIETKERGISQIFKTAFIGKSNESDFTEFLHELAGQSIEQKINFDLNQKVKNDNYFKIPIEIILQSNFSNVVQYLSNLEKSKYYLEIESIKFNNLTSEEQAESNVRATISGYFYSI